MLRNYPSVTLTRISWDLWFELFGFGFWVLDLSFEIFVCGSLV